LSRKKITGLKKKKWNPGEEGHPEIENRGFGRGKDLTGTEKRRGSARKKNKKTHWEITHLRRPSGRTAGTQRKEITTAKQNG